MWILIFQYPAMALAVAIETDITQAAGVFCEYETKAYFAKLWVSLSYTSPRLSRNLGKQYLITG